MSEECNPPAENTFEAQCQTCGKEPGFHCRAHYVARIKELEALLEEACDKLASAVNERDHLRQRVEEMSK